MIVGTWQLASSRSSLNIVIVKRCADLLTRMGVVQERDFMSFVSPPVDICNVFEDDLNGVYFNRMRTDPIVIAQFV